jgi:hypothetical protein
MAKNMTQPDIEEPEINSAETFQKRNEELLAENERLKREVARLQTERDNFEKRIPIKGFQLLPDDPFAMGTMRSYCRAMIAAKQKIGQMEVLPFTLPYSNPLARKELEMYIVRAAGGGDRERAESAKKALEFFPK